jgi:DNA-binding beta-propeller fold protein YncE
MPRRVSHRGPRHGRRTRNTGLDVLSCREGRFRRARRRCDSRCSVPAPSPHNIVWDGISVVVTSPSAGRVTVLDPRTLRTRRVFAGLGFPHDVEARGRLVFVTDEARGQLLVLDLRSGRISARIPVGPRPHDLAVVGSRLDRVVVTHRAPMLTVVDPLRRSVVAHIPAGGTRTTSSPTAEGCMCTSPTGAGRAWA